MPEYSKNNYVLYVIAKPEVKLYLKPDMTFTMVKSDAKDFYSKEDMDAVRSAFKFDLQEELGCARVYERGI